MKAKLFTNYQDTMPLWALMISRKKTFWNKLFNYILGRR